MDSAKKYLAELKDKIYDKLHNGFALADIQGIADMIEDIETLERFIARECEYPALSNPQDGTDDMTWLIKNIEDELAAAGKYYKKWDESKDATFKTIGREELRHAETLIKMALPKAITQQDKTDMQELTVEYQNILKALS